MHVYLEGNALRQSNKRKGPVLKKLASYYWSIKDHFSICAFEYRYIMPNPAMRNTTFGYTWNSFTENNKWKARLPAVKIY